MIVALLLLLLCIVALEVANAAPAPPPTYYPTSQRTPQPSYAAGTFPLCYICGNATQRITKVGLILRLPTQFLSTCGQLELDGLNGQIQPEFCGYPPIFHIPAVCGCADTLAPSGPTEAPIAPPTFAPHIPPVAASPKPSAKPTNPVPPPTRKPSPRPSVVPMSRPIPTTRPIPPNVPQPTQSPTIFFGRMKVPPKSKNSLKSGIGFGGAGGH